MGRWRWAGDVIASIVAATLMAACAAQPAAEAPLVATPVADGVYAFIGSSGEASRDNRGEVGNAGFIVGDSGTVVINTGSSYRHGKQIIAAAERIGSKPVVLAIITQPLQEFVMGSAAFEERGIPIAAQADAARLIGQRCERCLRHLTQLLGAEAMRGTKVIVPAQPISGSQQRMIGGRALRVLDLGWAQTPGDLAVLDERSGVLFAGGLVSIGRVPELRDADQARWRLALEELETLRFDKLIPGYGPIGTRAAIAPVTAYLDALDRRVLGLLREGASLSEALSAAPLPDYAGWALYRVVHPRNVQQTYLRLEAAAFER